MSTLDINPKYKLTPLVTGVTLVDLVITMIIKKEKKIKMIRNTACR